MPTRHTGIPPGSAYRAKMGRSAETDLIVELEAEGWLCGSRRHIPGPGDVLAVKANEDFDRCHVHLIEVKTNARGPFHKCGPTAREALRRAAADVGGRAFVAWRPYPSEPWRWLPDDAWP